MLVVTAPDLRAGQGYVRCGRCANVFNALVNLSDGPLPRASDLDASAPAAAATDVPDESAPAPEIDTPTEIPGESSREAPLAASEDIAMPDIGEMPTFEPEIVEPVIADGELEFHPEKTSVSEIFVDAPHEGSDISSGTFESIVLEGDPAEVLAADAGQELEALPLPPIEPPAAIEPEPSPPPTLDLDLGLEPPPPAPEPAAVQPPVDDLNAIELLEGNAAPTERVAASTSSRLKVSQPEAVFPDAEAIAERFIERKQSEHIRKLLRVGSIVLAVLLAAQLVHQSRRALAGSDLWGKPIRALYGAFGATLEPQWNVAAYDVRQLGAEAEPGDATRLIVRASIRNAATRAQPLPLLRLTLQDRYGNAIATRDLQPAEYLPAASSTMTQLGADERLDTELRVVDATRAAIGFEIDACLPSPNGVMECATDARRRLQAATR